MGVGVLPFFCVRSPAACSDLDFALDLYSLALFHMSCLLSRVLGIVWQYRFFRGAGGSDLGGALDLFSLALCSDILPRTSRGYYVGK